MSWTDYAVRLLINGSVLDYNGATCWSNMRHLISLLNTYELSNSSQKVGLFKIFLQWSHVDRKPISYFCISFNFNFRYFFKLSSMNRNINTEYEHILVNFSL